MMCSSPSRILGLAALVLMASLLMVTAQDRPSDQASAANLSLNGTAFHDLDGDGFLSPGEPGLANWTVRLTQNGTEISRAITDVQGRYAFRDLPTGLYALMEDLLPGWNLTAPGGGEYQVNLRDLPAWRLDFGAVRPFNATAIAASVDVREHPLLHPSKEEAARWTDQYKRSARALLSTSIAAEMEKAPGAHYSLLDHLQYNPAERDQGSCGNCWAWAGTGVLEIDMARQLEVQDRLSLQYLDSGFNGGCGNAGACCGGWLDNVASFYSGTKKAVPWSNANAQYQDGRRGCGGCSAVPLSSISGSPSYPLASIQTMTVPTQSVGKEAAISNIKNVLQQGKAVWFGYFLPSSSTWSGFMTFWNDQPESAVWRPDYACGSQYSFSDGGGHAVLCVGYDDTDPANRYWIMLNSWGTTPGRPNGLFRMSMDMNYDCEYGGLGAAFYWMTLDVSYGDNQNLPPGEPVVPSGPAEGSVGQSLACSSSASDPEGDQVSLIFDWNDGTTAETQPQASGATGSASHTWKKAGTYSVRVRAGDVHGAISPWSQALMVKISGISNDAPGKPSVPAGSRIGRAGKTFAYASYASDPNRDQVFYTFDWGDGTTTKTGLAGSGKSGSASHSWSLAGTYQVKVMATDTFGATSSWSNALTVRMLSKAVKNTNPKANPTKRQVAASSRTADHEPGNYTSKSSVGRGTDSSKKSCPCSKRG